MARYLLLFLVWTVTGFSQVSPLKKGDIRSGMEEMFTYHVECKELTPTLVKRSFKVFIEQFDPEKTYLLQEEVRPFLEMSEGKIAKIIQNYENDEFPDYMALKQSMRKAVSRAREWREEIRRELLLKVEENDRASRESYLGFAENEQQLKMRIRKQQIQFLKYEQEIEASPQRREKIFALLEKRLQRYEKPYLSTQEHDISLHILKAMAKSMDAHTAYFSPSEAFEMRASLEKQFEGIGIVLRENVDGVVITDLIHGGPAERSGEIVIGDLLVAVDGKSTVDVPYDDVLSFLKGEAGKEVHLTLKRKEEIRKVSVKREKIIMQNERLHHIEEPFADGLIGVLNLPAFYESGSESSAEKDMREAIREMKKKGKLLGLVLDMRENSGGFLSQAVKVAGLFITNGVIVISKYAQGEIQYLREIDGRIYFDGPLVILASKASASAAEIVAQALQDYGVALIVGDERTYGKGTIQYQTVTDDEAKVFFKVTVGKYYTVSGKSTQIDGVKADIHVPTYYAPYNIGERFLEFPLANDNVPAVYVDPLTDIDQRNKIWFQKNYMPTLQKRVTLWHKHLPVLKENSAARLERNKDFQLFLTSLESREASRALQGKNDLQMTEAIDILKDMIQLR